MDISGDTSNRILVAVDSSNFEYYCITSAYRAWITNHPEDEAIFINPRVKIGWDNLPNVLVSRTYRYELGKLVQHRLDMIMRIVKDNHQEEIDLADGIDVFFVEDDKINGNFRKLKYPEYKANRVLRPRRFDMSKVKEYIQNVLFKELGLEERFGYKFVKIQDCESDDIIATLMKRFTDYRCRIILSSDRDFLQISDVHQYNMGGQKVKRIINKDEEMALTPDEYRLWKIIRGDMSDNIRGVFPKYGDVKSYRLVKDKPTLRKMLSESQEAANRYILNKYLIDFKSIPVEVEERIYKVLREKMDELNVRHRINEFSLNECMEI